MSSSPEPPDTRGMGTTMQILAWLVIGGMLVAGFQGWLDGEENPNRNIAATPGEARLSINRGGHYVGNGLINGREVVFLVDTGASDVVLPGRLAKQLKLERGFAHTAITAAGAVQVYSTRLDSVQIGGIKRRDVSATINPHMNDGVVLLGMSFMRDLEVTHRNDVMILRQH